MQDVVVEGLAEKRENEMDQVTVLEIGDKLRIIKEN